MPRDVSFKEDEVLVKGMALFWRKGYRGTSMRDIARVTQLHPGSLYHSFGNKRDFFIAVADYYYKDLTANINRQLKESGDALSLLHDFFVHIVIAENRLETRGCLLVNTLIESTQDPDMQSYLSAMFSGLEEMFYWILVQGQQQKLVRANLDVRGSAKLLVNDYFGMRVQTMTEKTAEELTELVELRLAHFRA